MQAVPKEPSSSRVAFSMLLLASALAACTPSAQTAQSVGVPRNAIAVWHGVIPDSYTVGNEYSKIVSAPLVAHRPWTEVGRVAIPTLTIYPAHGKNTGVTVVVFPGGGYEILAIDLEGTEICAWMTSHGITCVLSKYRVPGPQGYGRDAPYSRSGPYPESRVALEDAQRTLRLVRFHARQWGIDPHRIGAVGFSAGGHLVAALSIYFGVRIYRPIDAADRQSARPDFAAAIYPGHLSLSSAKWDASQDKGRVIVPNESSVPPSMRDFVLNPAIHVTARTPPTFIVQAQDDPEDDPNNSVAYYIALQNAHVPAELHVFAHGGHAFGLRPSALPISNWPSLMYAWLGSIGVLR